MRAHANGIEIAYDDAGAGPPVVLVHGFPHRRGFWEPQLRALSAEARCIAPDLRGFGDTPAAAPISIDGYADDVAALLDALDIERATIVGLSMGGYIAFSLWRRHRARVGALVLVDTRADADSDETRSKRREHIALVREQGSGALADAIIEGQVGKTTRARAPETVAALHRILASAPVEGVVGALEAMMARPDSTATLATIDVPTLVVVGDEDALTPPKLSHAMHQAIAGSRLELIPGAGHVSSFEQPEVFNRLLRAFLAAGA
jgi:pimeloyl-ACP methyl ester carboxylesterase